MFAEWRDISRICLPGWLIRQAVEGMTNPLSLAGPNIVVRLERLLNRLDNKGPLSRHEALLRSTALWLTQSPNDELQAAPEETDNLQGEREAAFAAARHDEAAVEICPVEVQMEPDGPWHPAQLVNGVLHWVPVPMSRAGAARLAAICFAAGRDDEATVEVYPAELQTEPDGPWRPAQLVNGVLHWVPVPMSRAGAAQLAAICDALVRDGHEVPAGIEVALAEASARFRREGRAHASQGHGDAGQSGGGAKLRFRFPQAAQQEASR